MKAPGKLSTLYSVYTALSMLEYPWRLSGLSTVKTHTHTHTHEASRISINQYVKKFATKKCLPWPTSGRL